MRNTTIQLLAFGFLLGCQVECHKPPRILLGQKVEKLKSKFGLLPLKSQVRNQTQQGLTGLLVCRLPDEPALVGRIAGLVPTAPRRKRLLQQIGDDRRGLREAHLDYVVDGFRPVGTWAAAHFATDGDEAICINGSCEISVGRFHLPHVGCGANRPGSDLFRCGKAAAGRLLDGRTWDEVPSPAGVSRG